MENLCNKERNEHITELNKSIMKYDTYWYRRITGTTIVENFSLASIVTMAPKRASSKDTTESSTGEEIEKIPMDLLVYANTQLFVEKDSNLTWHKLK